MLIGGTSSLVQPTASFDIWRVVFGIWDGVLGVWDHVFVIQNGVFCIWDCAFTCDGAAERLLAAQAAWSIHQPAAGFALSQSQQPWLLKCSPLLSSSDINAFKISVKRLLAIFLQPTLPDTHGQLHPDVHLIVLLPR